MPRAPGSFYKRVAVEAAAEAFRLARAEAMRVPSLKELYLVSRKNVVAVKVVERRYRIPPRLLKCYAVMLLRHAKERFKRPHLVLVVKTKLTLGALQLAQRLKWIRVVPVSVLGDRVIAYLRILLREIYSASNHIYLHKRCQGSGARRCRRGRSTEKKEESTNHRLRGVR